MRPGTTERATGRWVARIAAPSVLVAAVLTPSAQAAPTSVCDRFAEGKEAGRVLDPGIDEASGIVASRVHPDVLWTHNDSGGEPEIYALSPTGEMLGTYRVAGAENLDWEDIAIGGGPRPGSSYLYIGDIGSNFRARDDVVVYRVAEPDVAPDGSGGTLVDVDVLRLRYPDGIVDAEAMIVDPLSADLYILTKLTNEDGSDSSDGFSRVMRAHRHALRPGAVITMEEVASFEVGPDYAVDLARGRIVPSGPLPGSLVTAADVSPDGSTILVRTYQEILAFPRPAHRPLEEAFDRRPCHAPERSEAQGEAVGFSAAGDAYFTIGEGLFPALNHFPVTPPLAGRRSPGG